ncbi:hypothetical protein ACFL1R_04370 [Candidatus Latescibacterota bacterium]
MERVVPSVTSWKKFLDNVLKVKNHTIDDFSNRDIYDVILDKNSIKDELTDLNRTFGPEIYEWYEKSDLL